MGTGGAREDAPASTPFMWEEVQTREANLAEAPIWAESSSGVHRVGPREEGIAGGGGRSAPPQPAVSHQLHLQPSA